MGKITTRLGQIVCLLWSGLAFSHPFHSSYAELDWAENGKTLQVSLRVIPEEFETALEQHAGKPVVLGTDSADTALISSYLSSHFWVSNGRGERYPATYLGGEIAHDETWLHFTVETRPAAELTLHNTILMAQNPSQVNRVRFLWVKQSADLVFNREMTSASIPGDTGNKNRQRDVTETVTVTR